MDTSKLQNLTSVQPAKNNRITGKKEGKESNYRALYPSQQQALEKLSDWYHSNELECTLSGYAGTGKTFILRYFLENVVDKSFTITAPTHKALRVLEAQVGRKGMTLHSLHGLKPNIDLINFDIENPQFDPLNPSKIQNYNLIVIDECSMINKSLFQLNTTKAKEYKVTLLDEVIKLVIHSTLHMMGYDHIKDEDYEVMQKKEELLASKFYTNKKI